MGQDFLFVFRLMREELRKKKTKEIKKEEDKKKNMEYGVLEINGRIYR